MEQYYLLIDIDSGNMVSDYETKDEALDAIRALYDSNGPDAIQNYLLIHSDRTGEQTIVAAQDELVQLALGTAIARP